MKAMDCAGATVATGRGPVGLRVRVARTFFSRFRGLMLRRPLREREGLLITRCASVHTGFMRFPIDVVYLDAGGRVLRCVECVRPWRLSLERRAAHTLELAAGAVARFGIRPGDVLSHPALPSAPPPGVPSTGVAGRQRGAAMLEFTVVAPILTLLGLGLLQYGLLFFAKNQVNHAAFMAGRAGSMGNASLAAVEDAYLKALIPLYGGGRNSAELAQAYGRVLADTAGNVRIELLNPTRESFADHYDPQLTNEAGHKVIRNGGLAFADATEVNPNSGQNRQDANVLKLRITHGYLPKVPFMGPVFSAGLKLLDTGADPFHTQLVNRGRIPVVTHVTLQMLSDPHEQDEMVSYPGGGSGGGPSLPGDPGGGGAGDGSGGPVDGGDTAGGGGDAGGGDPLDPGGDGRPAGPCPEPQATDFRVEVSDASLGTPVFESGSAVLTDAAKAVLDAQIAEAQAAMANGWEPGQVTVYGYTDPLGDVGYRLEGVTYDNIALSQARAQAVVDYLRTHGLAGVDFVAVGRGSADLQKTVEQCLGRAVTEPELQALSAAEKEALKVCLANNRRVTIDGLLAPSGVAR